MSKKKNQPLLMTSLSRDIKSRSAWRIPLPIFWLIVGLAVVGFLSKCISALALNLARVAATPIWMRIDREEIFDYQVDMRTINNWLEIALRLDPGNQQALYLELERDMYLTGRPSRTDNPTVQAVLASLQNSSMTGLSPGQQDSRSKVRPLNRYAVARYWWSLALEQYTAAQWNEAVASYQMGFIAKPGLAPETIRHGYYLAIGHQVASWGNTIGEDKARYIASKYFWLADDVNSAVEQVADWRFSSTILTHYRSWAWYLVGVKAEAALEPADALEAYRIAVELDNGQILAAIAMKRLAEDLMRKDLLVIADNDLKSIAKSIDGDGGLAFNIQDGSGSLGFKLDEGFNGSALDVLGVWVWKPERQVIPAGDNWVQAGNYWIQAGVFPNLAVNPGFEWMSSLQGMDSIPGYRRNDGGPCKCGETPDPRGEQVGQVAFVRLDERDSSVTLVSNSNLTVQPNEDYYVSVDGRAQGGADFGNWVGGLVGVSWYDTASNAKSYEIIGQIRSDAYGTDWVHRDGIVRVPMGVSGLQIVLWNFVPDNLSSSGTFYWDNLSVIRITLPHD